MREIDPVDLEALERAIAIARRDPAEARHIDSKLAAGVAWSEVATSAAYSCQMTATGAMPWQTVPMFAHIHQPRRDEDAIALLDRLLAAKLSRYEPSPLEALARVESEHIKLREHVRTR